MATMAINATTARFCYLDLDVNHHRRRLATTAAFVYATNTRYGFSSNDLLSLGGSELQRLPELFENDHEWSSSSTSPSSTTAVPTTRPPPSPGCRVVVRLDWESCPMACENFATLCANGSSIVNDAKNCKTTATTTTTTTTVPTTRPPPSPGCRVVVRLDWESCPMACENFATLCANGSSIVDDAKNGKTTTTRTRRPIPVGESGKPLTYRKCPMHRCVPGFCLQGGDFVKHNGSGGECVFANKTKFKDEKLGLQARHDTTFGTLSMGNSGKNSNSSQFFFTLNDGTKESTTALQRCNGKHVVFGRLVSGGGVLRQVERHYVVMASSNNGDAADTNNGDVNDNANGTALSIEITECGLYHPTMTPGQGFWYDQPDPESTFSGVSPTFIVRPRVALLVPHEAALTKFRTVLDSIMAVEVAVCLESEEEEEEEDCREARAVQKILEAIYALPRADVVIVAPVCQSLVEKIQQQQQQHKQDEAENNLMMSKLDEVVFVAKPTEVVAAVHSKSWMAKNCTQWRLDGAQR